MWCQAARFERAELASRLAPDQATDCFLKAGFLAHYWRLAYRLGIEPRCSWREAETWTRRAPKGGDAALLDVVRAVRDAAEAGAPQGPAFCRPSGARAPSTDHRVGAGPGDAEEDGALRFADESRIAGDAYAASAPAPRRRGGWAPATQADAAEVETAMRVLVAARIEESVLVALADRRRALANRVVSSSAASAASAASARAAWQSKFHKSAAASPARAPRERDDAVGDDGGETFADAARADDAPWIVLSDAEVGEVKYRRLWVCWQWARARSRGHAAGLAGLAERRCDVWFRRAFGEQAVFAAAREALEVEGALREIRTLGVEHALCAAANARENASSLIGDDDGVARAASRRT